MDFMAHGQCQCFIIKQQQQMHINTQQNLCSAAAELFATRENI